MEFTGHTLYKINNLWLFDITTLTGYKVSRNKTGELTSCVKSYTLEKDIGTSKFVSNIVTPGVPFGVLRKSLAALELHISKGGE